MTLYITEDCRTCTRLRESLDEVAIAHETVVVSPESWSGRVLEGTEPPVLVDDETVVQGSANIFAYIDGLRQLRGDWLKYQSDTCYLD